MRFLVFADESGTHSRYKCYGIGALCLTYDQLGELNKSVETIKSNFSVDEELKWERLRNYRATIEAAKRIIEHVLDTGLRFHAIIVRKDVYRKWAKNEETAFYTTYHALLRHIARGVEGGTFEVFIDDRSDLYPKQDEVLEIITNRYLQRIQHEANISLVKKEDSKAQSALQCVDILTGAITADTNRYLDPTFKIHTGKLEVIEHFANSLGWDSLSYDTLPSDSFNIWHFPTEFRKDPATRSITLKRYC
jgi:hypothetical protein